MSVSYLNFKPESPELSGLYAWWQGLEEDRGGRAALRRARSLEEVAFSPAYHDLLHRMERLEGSPRIQRERLALVAALAARVERSEGESVAHQMGAPVQGSKVSRISTLRFNRILQVDDDELGLLLERLRRLLDQLGRTVNLGDLAASAYGWSSDTRKRWARDYYRSAS